MDNLRLKVENIVAKGEIARFEQFLLLSLCFQKAVCCRGVRKRLYEGKSLYPCKDKHWTRNTINHLPHTDCFIHNDVNGK